MPDESRIKELGQLGETDFKRLCITARVSSSRPDLDENGWDFLVELPPNRLPMVRRDAQPSAVKLLCQVKATDSLDDLRLSLKVSTFERLATAAMPAFIFVLVYEGGDEAVRMYLCHVGRERIGRTLKRIRELEAGGRHDLNHHEMTLTVLPEEEFRNGHKGALLDDLTRHTGIDANAYGADKAQLLRTIGFDRGRMRFAFTTAANLSQFVDASLGLGELAIEGGVISDVRFDIELPDRTVGRGTLRMEPTPAGACDVVAWSKRLGMRVEMGATVYVPDIPGLDDAELKARIVAGLVEAVLAPPTCSLKFDFDADTAYDLDELRDLVRIICICGEPDARLEFRKGGACFGAISNLGGRRSTAGMRELEHRLELLKQFFGRFGYRGRIRARPSDVFGQEQALRLVNLAFNPGTVRVTLEEPLPAAVSGVRTGVFATPMVLRLGDEVLIAFCQWQARMTIRGSSIACRASKCAVWGMTSSMSSTVDELVAMGNEFDAFVAGAGSGVRLSRSLDEAGLRAAGFVLVADQS